MEPCEYNTAVENSNKHIALDAIIQGNQFEKVVIVSTILKGISENIQNHFTHLGIDYEIGPSIKCGLNKLDDNFRIVPYDMSKNLFLTLHRHHEAADLETIDSKLNLGIALLTHDSGKRRFPESLPKVRKTIIIPQLSKGIVEAYSLRAAYLAADIISRNSNPDASGPAKTANDELKTKLAEFQKEYGSLLYCPVK
ncbi:MAG: hypothetical protein Q8O89_08135 [Nanoarchaeota archaeon]|nr:hypothetical protein [Nanoarchaeota archaeon]